ncbi:IclR family transcriptional regulator [Microlunatus sp. GCM10028923]|uniref:IclR family transcriptional regulator n=1 Tax=Microlunatus sp. GCM10028923 TaxID=3273400 RepID=UPI003624131E
MADADQLSATQQVPAEGVTPERAKSPIQAIDRAVALLEAVAHAGPQGASLKELSEATGLHASTGRTLLSSLMINGLVDQLARNRRYVLGTRLIEFNRIYVAQADLSAVAAPIMRQLWEDTAETVHLSVLQNDLRVDIAVLVSPQLLNVNPTAARFAEAGPSSLYRTAAGKVLLAGLSDDGIRATLDSPRFADAHHALPVEQVLELTAGVRAQGHATNFEEEVAGVCGVAAPVSDSRGVTIAALCIGYPAVRHAPDYDASLLAAVTAGAKQMSRLLGGAADG